MELVTDVKPCPFCGEERVNIKTSTYPNRDNEYTIVCWSCAAEGGWAKTTTGARRNWNMRTEKKRRKEKKHE